MSEAVKQAAIWGLSDARKGIGLGSHGYVKSVDEHLTPGTPEYRAYIAAHVLETYARFMRGLDITSWSDQAVVNGAVALATTGAT